MPALKQRERRNRKQQQEHASLHSCMILGRRNAQAKAKGRFTFHGGKLKDSHGMQLPGSNHIRRPLFTFCLYRVHGGRRYKRTSLYDDAAARVCDNSHLAALGALLPSRPLGYPIQAHPAGSVPSLCRSYVCVSITMIT